MIVLAVHTSHNNRTPARAGGKVIGAVPSLATSGKECFLAKILQIGDRPPNTARRVEVSLTARGFRECGALCESLSHFF